MTRGLAYTIARVEDEIDEANAALEVAQTRKERRPLNKRLHYLRGLLSQLESIR